MNNTNFKENLTNVSKSEKNFIPITQLVTKSSTTATQTTSSTTTTTTRSTPVTTTTTTITTTRTTKPTTIIEIIRLPEGLRQYPKNSQRG
jgi:hypothetical protein